MYDSMLGKASFLLHTVLLEYFAVGENLCESAKSATLCDLTISFWQKFAYARCNTVSVRSVVIMVVGLQVWGYGRQQGSSEEGYTQ